MVKEGLAYSLQRQIECAANPHGTAARTAHLRPPMTVSTVSTRSRVIAAQSPQPFTLAVPVQVEIMSNVAVTNEG